MTSFWTTPTQDPKRNYRFLVEIGRLGVLWYAKSADRPTYETSETKHSYLNHTFKYPGRVTWSDVSVKLVDPVEPDATSQLSQILIDSGYVVPSQPPVDPVQRSTISKSRAILALGGPVRIQMINGPGDIIESWQLYNSWIKNADFSNLSYDNEDLSEVALTFAYDWASVIDSVGTEFNGLL